MAGGSAGLETAYRNAAITCGAMLASTFFYPVAALPWFLRPLATALPTTHAFAAGRSLIDGHGMQWGQLGLATGSTVVAGLAALAFLVLMLGTFRRRGFVTRYS